jgi:hypothetical protein
VFIPLVDILRCARPHEATWLVASIERAEARDIVDGTLGCPICLAEYEIRDGIVYYDAVVDEPPSVAARDDEAMRLAAALELTDARMVAVLHGEWGAHARLIRELSPAQLLLVNPPRGVMSGDGVSIVVAATAPLAQASVHAVAIDSIADEAMTRALCSALRGEGRMVGRLATPIPAGLVELARDAEVWVARRPPETVESAPVQLGRKRE